LKNQTGPLANKLSDMPELSRFYGIIIRLFPMFSTPLPLTRILGVWNGRAALIFA
jgi:hypothetical protein